MNKTVELVNQWAAFEEKHPDGSVEDFCRYLLIHRRESESSLPLTGGLVPLIPGGLLLKIIGRIHRLNRLYVDMALEGSGLSQLEEFGMLVYIQQEKKPRKTEVIHAHLMELSSGTDMLNRLMKRGFITEQADKDDKRSKRIILTPAGERTTEKAKLRIIKVVRLLTHFMSQDDVVLCIQLLKRTEQKFSALLPEHRGKDFDAIYNEVLRPPNTGSTQDPANRRATTGRRSEKGQSSR